MVKHLLLAASAACMSMASMAQTVATFEDVTIPTGGIVFSDDIANGTNFTINSGNARFDGEKASWGGWTMFNVSKESNVISSFPGNMNSSIVGGGFNNSTQFAVCNVNMNWAGNYENVPVGVKLLNNAQKAAGFYVTNSTYTYDYIQASSFYSSNAGYFHLIVKGYLNGAASTDSVVVKLADYTGTTPILMNTWEWVNLLPLGNVDSVTFNLATNDDAGGYGSNTPNYFVIDNFTTLESISGCTDTIDVTVNSITENSATVNWALDTTFTGIDSVELVINQSNSVVPTDVPVVLNGLTTYNAQNLTPNTAYHVHLRAYCALGGSFNNWTSVPFTTLEGVGIKTLNKLEAKIYPNPTTDNVIVEYSEPLNMIVVDMTGKQVLKINKSNNIDMSQLAAGQYLIQLSTKDGAKSTVVNVSKL